MIKGLADDVLVALDAEVPAAIRVADVSRLRRNGCSGLHC